MYDNSSSEDETEVDDQGGKDDAGRMQNPMFADVEEAGRAKEITRKELDAALEKVERESGKSNADMFRMMDKYYKNEVEKVLYEVKPHHSALLHEAPTNWYAPVLQPASLLPFTDSVFTLGGARARRLCVSG